MNVVIVVIRVTKQVITIDTIVGEACSKGRPENAFGFSLV